MSEIDVKELIWRAYTANPVDFIDKAKKIIFYAENQEIGRQLFVKNGLWKDFQFNKQKKQWETQFVQEGIKKWIKFKTPAMVSQYEQDAERVVEKEIRDKFFSEIKQAQELSQKEESIIHEYLQNTTKEKLLKLLYKIQDKEILSYYEHSYKKQELKLLEDNKEALHEKAKYSMLLNFLKKWDKKIVDEQEFSVKMHLRSEETKSKNEVDEEFVKSREQVKELQEIPLDKQLAEPEKIKLQIKWLEQKIKDMDLVLARVKEQQETLVGEQLEIYFNFENSEYFGVEIPIERLQNFLRLEQKKLATFRQESSRLRAEVEVLKEKKPDQLVSKIKLAQDGASEKEKEIKKIIENIGKISEQITAMKGDMFTPLLQKSSEEPTTFGDRILEPKLFSMVNNDAWLENSNFQGGNPGEIASIFLEFIHGGLGENVEANVVELEKVIEKIEENSKKISECIRAGQLFESKKDIPYEEKYKKYELIEDNKWVDLKEKLEDIIYVEKKRRFTYVAHYYDGMQWCASAENKSWTEPGEKKIKKRDKRRYMVDIDLDSDEDLNLDLEQKPIETIVKELMSSFGIFEDLNKKNEIIKTESERKKETERLDLIKALAFDFQQQIKNLHDGQSFFFAGGFYKHAILYEFRKETNGIMSIIVYNTGAGAEYHEHQTTFYQGIFKQKHFPAYVYQFPDKKIEEPEFQGYLEELLKADIASNWKKASSNPDVKSVAKISDQKDLYEHVLPLAAHLDGKRVDPKVVVTKNSFITGQRSGKCSEALFHPVVRAKLGARSYQRFMCAYRKEMIAHFANTQAEKNQLSNPVIQRQLRNAVSNLSKRVYKNHSAFTRYEIASIVKFVAQINQKLDLAVQGLVVGGLSESSISFQQHTFEVEKFPAISENLSSINTETTQNLNREQKNDDKDVMPLLECSTEDTLQILMEKMENILFWSEKAVLGKSVNHREIVFRIEKILMTWPLHKEFLDISVEQKSKILSIIKNIINIYSQQSMLQFGANLNEELSQLMPQQVMTLLSGLAILAQTRSGKEGISVKELMNEFGASTVLQKNKFNPYLSSAEFSCDTRMQQLLEFFNQFPKDKLSVKDIYIKLIEEDPEEKKCLLSYYDNLISSRPKAYNIDPEALQRLSNSEKCILVLCHCKTQIASDQRVKEVIRKFDDLANVDNIQAVIGKMLSNRLRNDSQNLLKTLTAADLNFFAKKNRELYQWEFQTPSSLEKFGIKSKIEINANAVSKSKRTIQDKDIENFLRHDVNREVDERHIDDKEFQSSTIQVGQSEYQHIKNVITQEEFYFKQFCHVRSSADCQVLSTVNFFQENMTLLAQDKWQTVCESNVFQPNLLLQALRETPNAYDTLYVFLRKGLLDNIKEGVPNAVALFFIKMQILLNNYLIETQSEYTKSAIDNLEQLNASLVDIIKKTKDKAFESQLYYYQVFLLGRLIPHIAFEKTAKFVENYLRAKLSGTVDGLSENLQNPFDFITQEKIRFSMESYLIQNPEQVNIACAEKLKEIGIPGDIKSFFEYPNVFYSYNNESGEHLVDINLESGQILNDGKQFLPLPSTIFNNQQFVDLFGNSVTHAFHCIVQYAYDREPSIYEIEKDGSDYWIKKTFNGYIFQKNISSKEQGPQRYELITYQTLRKLESFIPKTLADNNHHFWLSIHDPKELRIEEKGSNREVCRITGFDTEVGRIELSPFKIWTQAQTAASLFGKKFSCFENTKFIEVRELESAIVHDDAVLNQPLYIITLPRYQLTFHVIKTDPLVINCVNPEGTLLLSETFNDLSHIKNALFLEKKSGERIALLPRQYFIVDETLLSNEDALNFEYTPVCLDTENAHQKFVIKQNEFDQKYCKQSEFLTFTLDLHGKATAKNGADALYLAYVHLANFDPESALSVLQACEKSGGIKGTQKEIENLMLIFSSLPASTKELTETSEKAINTPEFIAVKAYALYLYASSKYKDTNIGFIEPLNTDGKCFYIEAKNFQAKLPQYIDTALKKYQSVKNKIPVNMQLTAQQELECLNLSDAPLLVLQRNRLLAENFQREHVRDFDSSQQKSAKKAQDHLLEHKLFDESSEYLTQTYTCTVIKDSENETEILNLMDLPRTPDDSNISGKDRETCINQYGSNKKIAVATEKLALNLDLKDFFENFLTYYHIATSKDLGLMEERKKLKNFLSYKLKIIGNGHRLYGQNLIIILYKILEDEQFSLKSVQEFLKPISTGSYYSYSNKVDGYIFDKSTFYNELKSRYENLSVTTEVEGVRKEVFSNTPKQLASLLAESNEPLAKARSYILPKPLSYPSAIDILEKYQLQSIKDIAKSANSAIFLAEYKQLAFSGEEKVFSLKEAFKKEKEELKKISFENFSAKELAYEKAIGEIRNKIAQKQSGLATQHFSVKAQKEALSKTLKNSLNASKQCKEILLGLIKDMINQGPASQESNRLHQLALQGKITQEINEQMILNLYLLGDEKSFVDSTGLAPAQVVKVYSLITEYLYVATHCQQLETIDKKLTEINDKDDKDISVAFANIANLLAAQNNIDPSKDSPALSVFQFCGEVLLRPEQVAYLRSHVERTDHQFKDLMSQLIMGFGKTFLLPIIAKAKATGNNLSVIEVPDPLFNTNVRDLNNASMRFLNQKTKSLRFNRQTPCSAVDLKALYEWLVNIKHNRDYLVTTGESIASINLRYVEILKSISQQQALIAAMGNEKVSAELEEVKVLTELINQAHWLEKTVKLFKFEADAIIDEVHTGLNVRKKLIYSLGLSGVDQKEINIAIKLYEFLLPLQVYHGHTVEDIIKNPGIVPPGKEELWKTMMSNIAEQLTHDRNSPILDALNEVGNTKLVKKYLLNDLEMSEVKTIESDLFSKLSSANKHILSLYKAELTRLLPSALKKENGKHYGLLLDKEQLQKQPCAVPFIASDTPHIVSHKKEDFRTTHFANPDETINYTIQAYISKGMPDFMVYVILERFKEQAKLELIRDNKASYDLTETGNLFRELMNSIAGDLKAEKETFALLSELTLDNFDKNTEHLKKIVEKLQQSKPFIFYALENHILSTIKVEQSTLEYNSNQRAYLYKTVQGIGGTTNNYRSIARMVFDQQKYMGTNGVTVDHIVKKVEKTDINIIDNSKEDLVFKLLKKNTSKENLTHAIIDAGGLFTGATNFMVAEKIANYFQSTKEGKRKYVLFFNEKNEFCAINVHDYHVPRDIILIGSTEQSAIKKALNNCKENEWLTYYDQLHIEGTDVLQSSTAKASITFSYDTTLSKFLQAAMRMRGLAKDQKLEVFMDPHILESCFNRHDPNDPPSIEEIIDFLYKNEVAELSEEHLRFVLQEMDNTLYQEILLLLLKNESESDVPNQQLRKAEILNTINTDSSLFLKTRVESLFERYGAVENQDAALKSVLEEKQKKLIALRTKLLSKISFMDSLDEEKSQKFKTSIEMLVEMGIENCKPTVLFRENFDQDTEAEAETETEAETEAELEADFEVSKLGQDAFGVALKHRVWICKAIDNLRKNSDQFEQTLENIVPLSSMLQSIDTVNTAYLEVDPKLYISKNHISMYAEQHDLFDSVRMSIQDILMFRDKQGILRAMIITPNEAQELKKDKKEIFENQHPQMWIESSTGIIYAGARPLEVKKDLQYLKIKEQINFINGDIKSLLMQDKYVWLPRHLEVKKTLLSTKILTNRPDQVEYTTKLLTRAKALRVKYEQVAVQLLRGVSERAAVEHYFTVRTDEDINKVARIARDLLSIEEILKLRSESKDEENILLSACKLIATFQDFTIDTKLLNELYMGMPEDTLACLSNFYAAKKILLQLHVIKASTSGTGKTDKKAVLQNQFAEILQKIKSLWLTNQGVIKKLLTEAVVCNDPELIAVTFKVFPNVLNEITDPLHPVAFAMKNRDYLRLTDLLEQHFSVEKREPENAAWIRTAFDEAARQNDLKFLRILIEKSDELNLPVDLMEKVIIVLSENEQDELLKTFYEKSVLSESLAFEGKDLKQKYENLLKALKINVSDEIDMSPLTLDGYGHSKQFEDFTYVFEQANFTVFSRGTTQLMMACERGDLASYNRLIESGANVFQKAQQKNFYSRVSREYDVFAYAVGGGNVEIISDLLQRINVVEQLSLDSVKGVLLQLAVNMDNKKFNNTFANEILKVLVDKALLPEKAQNLTDEFLKLFECAIKNSNFILAKTLIQITKPENVSSVCPLKNILDQIKAIKKSPGLSSSEIIDCFLLVFEKIPLNEKLKDPSIVLELRNSICILLEDGHTDIARRILNATDEHNFNLEFLNEFTRFANYERLKPHLGLIKEYSTKIDSVFFENRAWNEQKPVLANLIDIFNKTPELDAKENAEDIDIINDIISTLIIGKNTAAIFSFQSNENVKYSNKYSQPLLISLLNHAARNPSNQKCILGLLQDNYPGNLEFNYTVYDEKERVTKDLNENLLLWAIKNNYKEVVELLLAKGARLSDIMPKSGKSGFDILYGTPQYIDKFTPEQLALLENVLTKEKIVDTLNIDKYFSYLQTVISQKKEVRSSFSIRTIGNVDMGLVSQLISFAASYENKIPEEHRQSIVEAFIQTAINAINPVNDILEVCQIFFKNPVFMQYFSEQTFVKIKDKLLDSDQYTIDAEHNQRNVEFLKQVLEKTSLYLDDFPKFVECCFWSSRLEQKSDDNMRIQIFDSFSEKFSADKLLNVSNKTVEQLSKLSNDFLTKIIDASIIQHEKASSEVKEIIRLKLSDMLNFIVKTGDGHKVEKFLSKTSGILNLDKNQQKNLLFSLFEHNFERELDSNALESMLEKFDVKSIVEDTSSKENLIKLSIQNYGRGVFLDYLLSKGYVDKLSPAIVEKITKNSHTSLPIITKFLKNSIALDELLTAMPDKYISKFIESQLSCKKVDRVGDIIMQKLGEKIGLDNMAKIILEMDLIKMPPRAKSEGTRIAELLAITEFPTLCVGILAHYEEKLFSDLKGKPFYNLLAQLCVDPETLQDFGERFDEAAAKASTPQNRPQS